MQALTAVLYLLSCLLLLAITEAKPASEDEHIVTLWSRDRDTNQCIVLKFLINKLGGREGVSLWNTSTFVVVVVIDTFVLS